MADPQKDHGHGACPAHEYLVEAVRETKELNAKIAQGQQTIMVDLARIATTVEAMAKATVIDRTATNDRIAKLETKVERLQARVWQISGGVAVAVVSLDIILKILKQP